jgi:ATP-dependent exoDNAse (exonuclease V) alpha subunit
VEAFTWELSRTSFDEEAAALTRTVIGRYTQMPIVVARAITIHKAQGKTFDEIVIDLAGPAFAHGQVYVALSRCRTLEGITLLSPITKRDIFADRRVAEFLRLNKASDVD